MPRSSSSNNTSSSFKNSSSNHYDGETNHSNSIRVVHRRRRDNRNDDVQNYPYSISIVVRREGTKEATTNSSSSSSSRKNEIVVCLSNTVQQLWQTQGLCESPWEAEAVWEDFMVNYNIIKKSSSQHEDHNNHKSEQSNNSCGSGTVTEMSITTTVFEQAMHDNFGLSSSESLSLFDQWVNNMKATTGILVEDMEEEENDQEDSVANVTDHSNIIVDAVNGEEEEEGMMMMIGEGECELCERYISLTRHHLIPKCTWNKMEPKLWLTAATIMAKNHNSPPPKDSGQTASDNVDNDNDEIFGMVDEGLHHLVHDMQRYYKQRQLSGSLAPSPSPSVASTRNKQKSKGGAKKGSPSQQQLQPKDMPREQRDRHERRQLVRSLVQRTCQVCRPCHSAIHQTHDNLTLALSYNTLDKLIDDPNIAKFSKWANKQRTGKYGR